MEYFDVHKLVNKKIVYLVTH